MLLPSHWPFAEERRWFLFVFLSFNSPFNLLVELDLALCCGRRASHVRLVCPFCMGESRRRCSGIVLYLLPVDLFVCEACALKARITGIPGQRVCPSPLLWPCSMLCITSV